MLWLFFILNSFILLLVLLLIILRFCHWLICNIFVKYLNRRIPFQPKLYYIDDFFKFKVYSIHVKLSLTLVIRQIIILNQPFHLISILLHIEIRFTILHEFKLLSIKSRLQKSINLRSLNHPI